MSIIKVIAIEIPFLITFLPNEPVRACAMKDKKLHIYTSKGSLLNSTEYEQYIDIVAHAVNEGRFEWCDIDVEEGQKLTRNYDHDIFVDDSPREPFARLESNKQKGFSDTTLKLFNEFLKACNKDNKDMVNALEISYKDGFFRKEVEQIVQDDTVDELGWLDKEIIVRCRLEGPKYVIEYVKKLWRLEDHDKFIDINYFFRRVLNLEKHNYISLE